MQEKIQNGPPTEKPRRTPWLEFCSLLALAQVLIAGYRYGVANQSIQTTILKHLINPSLFADDSLVQTISHYPSMFFSWLACILSSTAQIQPAYFFLHIATTFGIMCGICLMARGLTGKWLPGMLALIILAAGHWSGLAESNLYTMEFTHTRAALCFAVLSLGFYLCGHYLIAFIMHGLTFSIHPLMACYTSAMLGVWFISDLRRGNWKKMFVYALPATILAAPIIMWLLSDPQVFDSDWIRLVRIRSPHHVFPSAWWATGNTDIPQFMLLTGFAVLSLSSARLRPASMLKAGLLAAVVLAMFLCGSMFTEVFPIPIVMRLQLFRSSRFLALFAIITVAFWGTEEVREVLATKRHIFRVILPAIVIIAMAIPILAPLLPSLLIVTAAVLLLQRRLTCWAAAWTGIVALCCVIAWRHIGFDLINLPSLPSAGGEQIMGVLLIGFAVILSTIYRQSTNKLAPPLLSAAALMLFTAVLTQLQPIGLAANRSDWINIQRQAKALTPDDAVVLVPPVPGGFRVYSDRSIVGEWRDGTQQFFDPDYAVSWWEKMGRLRDGMLYDESGTHLLARGMDFNKLPTAMLDELCREFGATHFVSQCPSLDFERSASNQTWTLYSAERIIHPPPEAPRGASDAKLWAEQEDFMQNVVYPNIEKNRKSDATLLLTDSEGLLLKGASYELRQVSSRFLFGSALPNFIAPRSPQTSRNRARVNEKYLKYFKELFNFTIIGYAGKWNAIEGQKGHPWFDNLDAYVKWCTENNIIIEYHFVSGYPPVWLKYLQSSAKKEYFLKHANRLIERYGDRIKYWQIVNERHNLNESPEVFELFREKLPDAMLGISNCARFYSRETDPEKRRIDMVKGMLEMEWLAEKKVDLDFFGFHAHRPFGLWADVRDIYEGLDYCKEQGVRVHISEFGVHQPYSMIGNIRTGYWTEKLQAEYYRRFYTVCFSHPSVDAINMWGIGPNAWIRGGGLLDKNYDPKPAFYALKKLIMEEWRTSMGGTVPLDGRLEFRGFHGTYELVVKDKESGSTFTCQFNVLPESKNSYHISWNKVNSSAEVTASD